MDRVIEIVNYLMKQVIYQGENLSSEKNLTEALVQLGYQPDEIEAALKLLYSISDTLKIQDQPKMVMMPIKEGHRVFSPLEQKRFSTAFRGEIMRLGSTHLLSEAEIEEILLEAFMLGNKEVGLRELDLLLNKVIKDEERLLIIAPHLALNSPIFLLN